MQGRQKGDPRCAGVLQDGCKRIAKLLDVAADKPQQVMAALPALLGLPEGETPLQVRGSRLLPPGVAALWLHAGQHCASLS